MSKWTTVSIEGYVLEVDVEKTSESNQRIFPTNTQCSCDGCQNYARAIVSAEPFLLEIMDSFGIDMKRASEIMEFGLHESNYRYIGFYHIVGKIIEHKNESLDLAQNDKIRISDSCSVSFTTDCALVPDDFPIPYFQMDVDLVLPRVLEYPYINKKVPRGSIEKIVSKSVKYKDKRMIKTITGLKYELSFSTASETIILYVEKNIYDYFKPGWEGRISYLRKSLYSINQ